MDKPRQSDTRRDAGSGDATRTPGPRRIEQFITLLGAAGFVAGIVAVFISSNHVGTVALIVAATLFVLVGYTGAAPIRGRPIFAGIRIGGATKYGPYLKWESYAYWTKANLQMLISVIAIGFLLVRAVDRSLSTPEDIFELISYALAAAAVIELAYTLFTPGPDEALDPVTLGLSALLLLQFARVKDFDYKQAVAALLYVLALGVLFGIRQLWSKADEIEELRRTRVAEEGAPPSVSTPR